MTSLQKWVVYLLVALVGAWMLFRNMFLAVSRPTPALADAASMDKLASLERAIASLHRDVKTIQRDVRQSSQQSSHHAAAIGTSAVPGVGGTLPPVAGKEVATPAIASTIPSARPWTPGQVSPLTTDSDAPLLLKPRLENDHVELLPADQWCEDTIDKHKPFPDITWGSTSHADQATYDGTKDCTWRGLPHMLNQQLRGVATREAALARAKELGLATHIHAWNWGRGAGVGAGVRGSGGVHRSVGGVGGGADELFFFGPKEDVLINANYGKKWPWHKYICPGSISIDVGTEWGDTLLLIAAASQGGVTLGLEVLPGKYLANEWEARLNPQLNIIPHVFGAKFDGGGTGGVTRGGEVGGTWSQIHQHGKSFRFRSVPLQAWVEDRLEEEEKEHISFIKIDIEGMDKILVATLGTLTARSQPLFLIEFYLDFRRGGCGAGSNGIWEAARKINYDVWTWDLQTKLDSCSSASAKFSLTVCHDPGKGTDLCDLVLVPAGIHPGKERGSICRPPMSKARVRDIMQRGAALGVVT